MQFEDIGHISGESFSSHLPSITQERSVSFGSLSVNVSTDSPDIFSHLEKFYEISGVISETPWRIFASLDDTSLDSDKTFSDSFGNTFKIEGQSIVIHGNSVYDLAITTEKLFRALMNRHYSEMHSVDTHAACIVTDLHVILLAGGMKAGKTTLALDALSKEYATLMANDKVLFFKEGDDLALTAIPDYLSVRANTAQRHEDFLMGLGITTEELETLYLEGLNDPSVFHYIPYSDVSTVSRKEINLSETDKELIVAFCEFSESNEASIEEVTEDTLPQLMKRLRLEETTSDAMESVYHHLAVTRGQDAAIVDAERIYQQVVQQSKFFSFKHTGDINLLLETLHGKSSL